MSPKLNVGSFYLILMNNVTKTNLSQILKILKLLLTHYFNFILQKINSNNNAIFQIDAVGIQAKK